MRSEFADEMRLLILKFAVRPIISGRGFGTDTANDRRKEPLLASNRRQLHFLDHSLMRLQIILTQI